MSRKEDLIKKLLSKPKDFTYNELKKLLNSLGYVESTKGKTSGSRVSFFNPASKSIISLHKPHPGNTLKAYTINDIIKKLKEEGEV